MDIDADIEKDVHQLTLNHEVVLKKLDDNKNRTQNEFLLKKMELEGKFQLDVKTMELKEMELDADSKSKSMELQKMQMEMEKMKMELMLKQNS